MGVPRLIAVPLHDGLAGFDRGLGPGALLAAAGLRAAETVAPPDPGEPEAARFSVAARLAEHVRDAHADADRFEIAAAAITYEPAADADGRMARSATRLLRALRALA